MTLIYNNSVDANNIINSTTWNEVVSANFTQDENVDKTYCAIISLEYTISNKNASAQIRVIFDNEERNVDTYSPPINDQYKVFTTLLIETVNSGLHNLTLQARGTSIDTITIRRKRIMILKQ